jgi:hypothetical protein
MRLTAILLMLVTLAVFAVAAVPCNAAGNNDQARYQWYGGRWWYWMPDNHWVYWEGNRWIDYRSTVSRTAQTTVGSEQATDQSTASATVGNACPVSVGTPYGGYSGYSGYSGAGSWSAAAVGSWGGNYFGRSMY